MNPLHSLQLNRSTRYLAVFGLIMCGLFFSASTLQAADISAVSPSQIDPADADPDCEPDPISCSLEKYTNGMDADSPDGTVPFIEIGQKVTWTYVIKNTGDVPLKDVTVVDDQAGVVVQCPKTPPIRLAEDETMTCEAEGVAEDLENTSATTVRNANGDLVYENIGTATGHDDSGRVAKCSDPSHYTNEVGILCSIPRIDIEKATNGDDADIPRGPIVEVGDTITWTYVVTNISPYPPPVVYEECIDSVTLINVAVTDDHIGAITCPKDVLDPGEPMTCTATGVAEAGQYANIGFVNAVSRNLEFPVTDEDPSHYFAEIEPAVDIEKHTNGVDADQPDDPDLPQINAGNPVTWSYYIENTGNMALVNLAVTDDHLGEICTRDRLEIRASFECTATGIAEAGLYGNLATVIGFAEGVGMRIERADARVEDSDPSHYLGLEPDAELTKPPGIGWGYALLGDDKQDLKDVQLDAGADVTVTVIDDPASVDQILNANETWRFSATGLFSAYGNLAEASAVTLDDTMTATDTVQPAMPTTGLVVTVLVNNMAADTPPGVPVNIADTVAWTYAVTNQTGLGLENIGVTHTSFVEVPTDETALCTDTTLAPGESTVCEITATALPRLNTAAGTVLATVTDTGEELSVGVISYYTGAEFVLDGPQFGLVGPQFGGKIMGRVFLDIERNGVAADGCQDPDEPGMRMNVELMRNGETTPLIQKEPNSAGEYEFTAPVGEYTVRFVPEATAPEVRWSPPNQVPNKHLDSDAWSDAWPSQTSPPSFATTPPISITPDQISTGWDAGVIGVYEPWFHLYLPIIDH